MIDTTWGGVLMWFILGILLFVLSPNVHQSFFSVLEGPLGRVFDAVGTVVLGIFPNAIAIGLTGGNLGKWLMGVKIEGRDNRPIGVWKALQRELYVVMALGFGIPIISLFTMIGAYSNLSKSGTTKYDRRLQVEAIHRSNDWPQYVGFTIGVLVFVVMVIVFAVASRT